MGWCALSKVYMDCCGVCMSTQRGVILHGSVCDSCCTCVVTWICELGAWFECGIPVKAFQECGSDMRQSAHWILSSNQPCHRASDRLLDKHLH